MSDRKLLRGAAPPAGIVTLLLIVESIRISGIWSELPARMASHFGPGGRPDGFTTKGQFVGMMGVIGGGTLLLLIAVPVVLRFLPPSVINLPNREYWLAPERREPALKRLGAWVAWFAVPTGLLLSLAVELTLRANLARADLAEGALVAGPLVYAAALAGLLVGLYRAFRVPEKA